MLRFRFSPARLGAVAAIPLCAIFATIADAQTPVVAREHRARDAVVGAFVGGAAGALIGFAVGSLGRAEPSCQSSPCEGHSYAKQGARVGLVVGIPVGAIMGWRGTFPRLPMSLREVSRPRPNQEWSRLISLSQPNSGNLRP